ncbi:MAG: LytTR family DNA-binding domain-containing protein, partial [Bacteroidota bacterium]
LSIYLWDFLSPSLFQSKFGRWTIGKAVLWYSSMVLFVGGLMFLYKSYLGGFRDFTFEEYLYVCGRVFVISVTVSFFILGIINYFRKDKISSISSNESCLVTAPNSKPIRLYFNELVYIESDDNYVDIHMMKNGTLHKEVFRSSLKNMEDQLVYSISPIHRCHRKFLINFNCVEVVESSSRSMTLRLKNGETLIPVSKQYVSKISQLLTNRP